MPLKYRRKALELNTRGDAFIQNFGQREVSGFVGFVDLVGFSGRVKGHTPSEMSKYLKPFLAGVVGIVFGRYALVDKTIGDEVMFILPYMDEDGGPPASLLMGQMLGGIHDLQRRLGGEYPFRIGLSYGRLYLDRIQGDGYSEWTMVGEAVHLAKRLQGLEELNTITDIGGAFGVLLREADAICQFEAILGMIAGFASRMTHEVIGDLEQLKGVSPARCALLLPRP
jgi:hypothetical protein